MARPGRPVSEGYQPMCCSVSQSASCSSEAGMVSLEEEDEPIFSLSKSSMDVVMATGPPHKRDPAWTRMDLRRSSSANAPAAQQQQAHPLALGALDGAQGPRGAGVQRWSAGSGSTHSRSSTPDTVLWRGGGGASRPSSLTRDLCATPDSPISSIKLSPPATPSPFTSPLGTPPFAPADLSASGSPAQTLTPDRQEDRPGSQARPSPPSYPPQVCSPPSPLPPRTSSPLTPASSSPLPPGSSSPSPPGSASPRLPLFPGTADECFPDDSLLIFRFPSPQPSSVSSAKEGADAGCLLDTLITELRGPGSPQGPEEAEEEEEGSREETISHLAPQSPAEGQETGSGRASGCQLQLPWQPDDICAWRGGGGGGGGGRSPLVSSFSDSRLGTPCCGRCSCGAGAIWALRAEGGSVTPRPHLVDAEAQTVSPCGSWWDLKRNTFASAMGSHSILGSPPGSRLNLKHSLGSHSNLVSPSSSMFPGNCSAGEEEEDEEEDEPGGGGGGGGGERLRWDVTSTSSQDLDRRRSCLKSHGEERDELGRRSSMKQVQWDENGMTWDVHGASVDPEVLSSAIQRHLELQNTPGPRRPSTKKKKAPKPPLLSSVVKAMTPELRPSGMGPTAACVAEGEEEEAVGKEGREGRRKEEAEPEEVPRRISRAEGAGLEEPEEEVYGEVGAVQPSNSPSCGSGHSRTRSVIRSLRRPAWCGGGSRTTHP